MAEQVILVDENDNEIGIGEKMQTHREGKLHRSFTIYVLNSKGELLLQQRAKTKYHSGGLWSNTCCSHQKPGEATLEAAHRRLQEEMGFDAELQELFTFVYQVQLDNALSEHEYDHVILGKFDGQPVCNPEEVEDWKFADLKELQQDIKKHPENYTFWFKASFDRVLERLKEHLVE